MVTLDQMVTSLRLLEEKTLAAFFHALPLGRSWFGVFLCFEPPWP